MQSMITSIDNQIRIYLLKTNNGQFYQEYIKNNTIDYYRLKLSDNTINDFNTRDEVYLKEVYAQHLGVFEIMINQLKAGDWVVLVGYQNKKVMIGEIDGINFTVNNNNRYITVNWLKEVEIKKIDARIMQYLYKKPILMDITTLKDPLLRLIHPLYKIKDHYHIIIHINQKDNILLRSLLGIQQLVYDETSEVELAIKIHLESPGIIEFISDNYTVVGVIIQLIRLFREFKNKPLISEDKSGIYETYIAYGIEKLEIDFEQEDI